jgi:NAD(P)-dependent dehydrogenase (short-subunit alcohol dehydrogenase family)
MPDLKDRVICVTGAGSGIALAISKHLASLGAHLSLADINGDALDSLRSTLQSDHPGARVLIHTTDVASTDSVNAWMAATAAEFGAIDGAVNFAGITGANSGVEGMTDANWDHVLGVNLSGVMRCMRAQIPLFRATAAPGPDAASPRKTGSIVNASSVVGLKGSEHQTAYSVSKHGVIGLTRSAAKEVGPRGIRVNCVAPYVLISSPSFGGPLHGWFLRILLLLNVGFFSG